MGKHHEGPDKSLTQKSKAEQKQRVQEMIKQARQKNKEKKLKQAESFIRHKFW